MLLSNCLQLISEDALGFHGRLESCLLPLMCLVGTVFPCLDWLHLVSTCLTSSPGWTYFQSLSNTHAPHTAVGDTLTMNQNRTTATTGLGLWDILQAWIPVGIMLDSIHWLLETLSDFECSPSRPWDKLLGASHLLWEWLQEAQCQRREKR